MPTPAELEKIHLESMKLLIELKNSSELNFSKLQMNFEKLEMQLDEARIKLDNFNSLVYNPDTGLYKRIGDLNYIIKTMNETQSESKTILKSLEEKVDDLENVKIDLIKIAGSRLENLDSAIKTNNNSKKILWTFILGVVAIAIEQMFKLF